MASIEELDLKKDDIKQEIKVENHPDTIPQILCKPMDIHNMLLFPGRKIILDIRSEKEFLSNHIALSTNIPINTNEKEVISKLYQIFKQFWWATGSIMNVYCYSNTQSIKNGSDIIWYKYIQHILLKYFIVSSDDSIDTKYIDTQFIFKSMFILCIDYETFEKTYDHLCTSNTFQHQEVPAFPSIIIENKLLLSGFEAVESKHVLVKFGVTHILNMATELENCFENDKNELSHLKYLQCKIKDLSLSDISSQFSKCIAFINDALNENNGNNNNCVLVHCFAGISRSSTIIIAYLMKSKKMSFEKAFEFTKQKRSIVSPNEGFVKQLKLWGNNCV
eukprot:190672_1